MKEDLKWEKPAPFISVIIPVYNEEKTITRLVNHLKLYQHGHPVEIVVVDGNSDDQTVAKVRKTGVKCLVSEKKGRAAQMNYGVRESCGEILYFVHADSIPPKTYVADHSCPKRFRIYKITLFSSV